VKACSVGLPRKGPALNGGYSPTATAPRSLSRQPIAVSLEGQDLGVVDEPVDHRRGDDLVAEDRPHEENRLFEVTISDARS
jgi:hypothetical protein